MMKTERQKHPASQFFSSLLNNDKTQILDLRFPKFFAVGITILFFVFQSGRQAFDVTQL